MLQTTLRSPKEVDHCQQQHRQGIPWHQQGPESRSCAFHDESQSESSPTCNLFRGSSQCPPPHPCHLTSPSRTSHSQKSSPRGQPSPLQCLLLLILGNQESPARLRSASSTFPEHQHCRRRLPSFPFRCPRQASPEWQ